jgi:KaiC/GvpD/RAD55 family RecA-like ATPase
MPECISTGVNGVDDLLDGKGVPQGHTLLISGGPGSVYHAWIFCRVN